MTSHRAQENTQELPNGYSSDPQYDWIATGQPDPFRAAGVPDRLVLVLNRDGINYHGHLTVWEYRALDVRRGRTVDGQPQIVQEMVVDASHPTQMEMTILLDQVPTAAVLVAELVTSLRSVIGKIPSRIVTRPSGDASCPDCTCCSVFACDRTPGQGCGEGCPCISG